MAEHMQVMAAVVGDVGFCDGGREKGLESRKWVRLGGCWLRSCHSTFCQLGREELAAS